MFWLYLLGVTIKCKMLGNLIHPLRSRLNEDYLKSLDSIFHIIHILFKCFYQRAVIVYICPISKESFCLVQIKSQVASILVKRIYCYQMLRQLMNEEKLVAFYSLFSHQLIVVRKCAIFRKKI